MWELYHKEGWALKNWCFWTVMWRRLLRVPWPARISNKSILKEINPEYTLKGLMMRLKRQSFGYLMWRDDSLKKMMILGKIEGRRGRGWQRMRWLNCITNSMVNSTQFNFNFNSIQFNLSKLWEIVKDREAWCDIVHGVTMIWTWFIEWTVRETIRNQLWSHISLRLSLCKD